jgi:hypothetical protein
MSVRRLSIWRDREITPGDNPKPAINEAGDNEEINTA